MKVTLMLAALLLSGLVLALTSCGEPAKTAPSVVMATTQDHGWQTRRCRCNRHDARGCVHWQCRRV